MNNGELLYPAHFVTNVDSLSNIRCGVKGIQGIIVVWPH